MKKQFNKIQDLIFGEIGNLPAFELSELELMDVDAKYQHWTASIYVHDIIKHIYFRIDDNMKLKIEIEGKNFSVNRKKPSIKHFWWALLMN